MLRNRAGDSGLGFASEFHQGWALETGVRTHDRLVHVLSRGQRLHSLQEQLRTFRATWCLFCRGLDLDFTPRGFSWSAPSSDESGPIRRRWPTNSETGAHPHRLALLGSHGRDL